MRDFDDDDDDSPAYYAESAAAVDGGNDDDGADSDDDAVAWGAEGWLGVGLGSLSPICRRLSCTTPCVLSRRAPPGSVVPESTDRIL